MNIEIRIPLALLITFFLAVLNSTAQDYYYTQCDSFRIDDNFKVIEHNEHEFKHSFSERTFVYCSPDSTREPLGFVNFNTTLATVETISHVRLDSFVMYSNRPNEYRYKHHFFNWKKINFRNGFAYVKETDLAHEYSEEGQFLLQNNNGWGIQLKAISSESNIKSSLNSIHLPLMHGYRLRICHQNGLANSGLLIAYETFRQSCPGASNTFLIIINEDGLKKLTSNFSTGEGGMFDSEAVYFPLKLTDGSVRLIEGEHIIHNGMDFEEVNLKEMEGFPYPKHIGVPIERLIVKTKSYTENIFDENGKELMDENDNYQVKVIHDEPIFYEWNGQELIELGSSYYLDRLDSLTNSPIDSTIIATPLKPSETEFADIMAEKVEPSPSWTSFISGFIGFLIGSFVFWIFLVLEKRKRN